jgi:hypothetical protein
MFHCRRRFSVADVASAEELATKLTEQVWTLCTGFRFGGYLFLNDSLSPDGAQEYAVVRESDSVQVESITFGWCTRDRALRLIENIVAGRCHESYGCATNPIEPSASHRCPACA